MTIRALEAGKAVLCEKPIANTLEDAREMLETAERLQGWLQIGFELRYSKLYTLTWDAKEDHSYYHDTTDQTRDVVRRVANGLPPMTPAGDAYDTMRLCFAAEVSADAGGAVRLDDVRTAAPAERTRRVEDDGAGNVLTHVRKGLAGVNEPKTRGIRMDVLKAMGVTVGALTLAVLGGRPVAAAETPAKADAAGPVNPHKAAKEQEPFIRVREVLSSVPWGGWIKSDMPLELRQQYFMPFWSEARLRRHLEMLKAFGFNSIQIAANPVIAWWVGADADGWRKRQLFRCRTAHELGLSVSACVWGAAVADAKQGGQQFSELEWHKPEDRARLLAWYRDQAEAAPYVDRVITHWVDPGRPQQGGIDTVVEMHNAILGIYRQKNPKIRGALSTWFMNGQAGWAYPGFEGADKLAAHPNLDPQTDIVHGGSFQGDITAYAKAGRRAAVWGWYTADDEISPALWVRMSVLERYFPHNVSGDRRKALAPTWTDGLAYYSIDDCFQGLNMQNLYVAGKLMQDPSLDAQELLDEFARGFVGEANGPAFAAALRAVERARTLSNGYNAKVLDAVEPPPGLTIAGEEMNTTWLDNTATAVDAAIAGMRTVTLAPEFKTAWPVTMEPAEYLGELNAHLEAIRQILAFLKGAREVEKLQAEGAPKEKVEAAIAALPKVVYDPRHTAGLEPAIYKQKLAGLMQSAGTRRQ